MLNVKELVITDYQHDLVLVNHLSFTLNSGEKIAIIGSEGSGKSTLLNVIKGEIPPFTSIRGDIVRPNVIAHMKQNIRYQHKDSSVEDFLFSERYFRDHYYDNVVKLSTLFNLNYEEIKSRRIDTFSGGECVKIALIQCLMIEPDMLLLDEPSNDLDFKTLLFLESFLQETSIPTLFISHDQRLLENVATGIIHLQHIRKFTAAKTTFLRVSYQTYKEQFFAKHQSDLMISHKQRGDYQKKMEKFRQIYQKVEYQQDQAVRDPVTARLLKKKIHSLKSQQKRYEKEKENFVEIPEMEEPIDIRFNYEEKSNARRMILDVDWEHIAMPNKHSVGPITLTVKGMDKIVIVGDNGVGKTTLLKYFIGHLLQTGIRVGYLSQNYSDLLSPKETPVGYIMKHSNLESESKIRQNLGALGLKQNEMLYPFEKLSEGTKLKVLLMQLTNNAYDFLVLDEPTRNISPINQDELYLLFARFNGAIIAVTHDRSFIEAVFDKIYELDQTGLHEMTLEDH